MPFRHFFYLYGALLVAICATNALQLANESLEADLTGAIKCDPSGWRYSRPTFKDCGIAVRRLPDSIAEGDFHNGGANDKWKLPMDAPFGTCHVRIDLPGGDGSTERCSWLGISNAASQLNIACHTSGPRKWKTGGWSTVGDHSRIFIRLTREPDSAVLGGNNATVINGVLGINGTAGDYTQVLESRQG